ncbi:MAG: DUF3987 domain-containing protein [bacterium]|nr:DUF3987 domain-containing protein [bacterium]
MYIKQEVPHDGLTKSKSVLEYAQEYAAKGFSIIPIIRDDSKKPAIPWKEYQQRKPTEKELTEWFGNGSNYNIGIVTGHVSGVDVVDLDNQEAIQYVKAKNFPNTPLVKTGNGYHLYYKHKEGTRCFTKENTPLPGIDFRGEGGYVVAPPSLHENGNQYQWNVDDIPFADLPTEILRYAIKGYNDPDQRDLGRTTYNLKAIRTPVQDLLEGVSEGGRNSAATRVTGILLNKTNDPEFTFHVVEMWNRLNKPPLSELELETTVQSIINKRCNEEESWPEIIPLDKNNELPQFPIEALPEAGRKMVEKVAEVNQIDIGLAASIYLSVLASCLSKKANVDLETHREPLNLYICSIADSGERKSSTMSALTKPLFNYQTEKQEESLDNIISTSNAVKLSKDRIKVLRKGLSSLEQGDEYEEISNELYRETCFVRDNETLTTPEYIVDDITSEALGIALKQNNERLAIISAEGGIFRVMAGLYNEKGFNIDLYLKGHCGDPCSFKRVSRDTIHLDSPAITIGLAVQPDVIQEIGSNKAFEGRGLLARFLYCQTNPQAGSRKRQREVIPKDLIKEYEDHIMDLAKSLLTDNPSDLKLNTKAQLSWDQFYNEIEKQLGPGGSLHDMKSWGSKLPGAVARIAGLLHIAKHGYKEIMESINAGTVCYAIMIGNYYLKHAKSVFINMKEDPAVESARKILEYIKTHNPGRFNAREVQQNKNAFKSIKDVLPGLEVLIEHGYIRETKKENKNMGRPKAAVFEVNLKIIKNY